MKIIEPGDVQSEVSKDEEVAKKILLLTEFQASKHYDLVMEVIDIELNRSEVKELLQKKGGDASEQEIGRLTMSEWIGNKKVQNIINILTKEYE